MCAAFRIDWSGVRGRFLFDQKFRKFRVKSEWKGHFPESHFGILGVPRELVPIFRKIGITGKFCSIRPFLLGPVSRRPKNCEHGCHKNVPMFQSLKSEDLFCRWDHSSPRSITKWPCEQTARKFLSPFKNYSWICLENTMLSYIQSTRKLDLNFFAY